MNYDDDPERQQATLSQHLLPAASVEATQQQSTQLLHAQQQQQQQQQQALRVIRRRILDIDLTVAKSLSDVVERRQVTDDLSASDVHAIVNTFDNVVADYFSPERWRPLRDAMGSPNWPPAEWRLALQRVDHAIAGIADRRRAIRRGSSDLLFEKIVLDELGLRCHLIRRAISGEATGARELIEEIQYYRQIQLTDGGPAASCQMHHQHQQQQQQQQGTGPAAVPTNATQSNYAVTAASAVSAASAIPGAVRFNAKVNVKEFKVRM